MILTGQEIVRRIEIGDIVIRPFDRKRVQPNSYDLTLFPVLKVYRNRILDLKQDDPTEDIFIPDSGYLLSPGVIYLAATNEWTETRNLAPRLDGKSSIGRKGVYVHITAAFGDIGFCGQWTLELAVVQPVMIYPNIPFCQISYHIPVGDILEYAGHYQGSQGVIPSRFHELIRDGALDPPATAAISNPNN